LESKDTSKEGLKMIRFSENLGVARAPGFSLQSYCFVTLSAVEGLFSKQKGFPLQMRSIH
jgi:hypothetical protein